MWGRVYFARKKVEQNGQIQSVLVTVYKLLIY